MESKPIVFHIGYPKAASTTLQHNLFAEHPDINYLSFHTPKNKINKFHTEEAKQFFHDLKVKNTIEYNFSNMAQLFENNIKPFLENKRINVFSNEGYLLPHLGDIGITGCRLQEIFGNIKIIIVIREQIDLITSLYNMRPANPLGFNQNGNSFHSLEEWIKVNFNNLQWSIIPALKYFEVISWYIDIFGKENVGILLFEELKSNPKKFLNDLSNFLNVNCCNYERQIMNQKNYYNKYNAMRLVPQYIPKEVRTTAKYIFPNIVYDKLSKYIYQTLQKINVSKKELPPNSNYWNILKDFYGDSNFKLMNEFGLDIEKYGYVI